jgi:alpha-glucosidase
MAGAGIDDLHSPDRRIQVAFHLSTGESRDRPAWQARFGGKPILEGYLGMETVEWGALLAGARVTGEARRTVAERVPVLFGKSSRAANRFNEIQLAFENPAGHRVHVVFRAYDDAVAFRYELPAGTTDSSIAITHEGTAFRVLGEPVAYVQYLENFKTSHEHQVTTTPRSAIRRQSLLDLPITFSWPDDTYVAITEAALRRYAGMSLMRAEAEAGGDALVSQLTPRADGIRVVRPLPMQTPWRVVLMGDRPGALLESETLYVLNEPSVIADTSWIQPGKITFHWWNGDVYDGRPGAPILSVEMAQRYIDFCASNQITAHSLTSTEGTTTPWYQQSRAGVEPGPDTDVTRPRAGFDLPAIRRYAESRGVRLWTWVHHAALRGRVEEAFAAFAKMGWSGMMVDFFDHDDQETIEFAEAILDAAARHRILIHFHGVWKPTGLHRTYPNLMNHEGVLNLEYLKWSDLCTPEHNLMMAVTRLIAGPMDYHLGGFRAVPRSEFKPQHVAPNVLGTRGHMLAMYVCFDNPMPMLADYPTAYTGAPGFDFLKRVPTWWDQTRVILGRIGEALVTARRKGATWYLGGLTAGGPRELNVPLSFLTEDQYSATVWKDGPTAAADPNQLVVEKLNVRNADVLKIVTALDGGFVAELIPVP